MSDRHTANRHAGNHASGSMARTRPTRGRVLISKLGLDGHDVGAKVVARLLRDQGFEVVYLGIRQRPAAVVATARDEDVDLIGISILSGAHLELLAELLRQLAEAHVAAPVVAGGVIPERDRPPLMAAGVAAILDGREPTATIIDTIARLVDDSRRTEWT